MYRQKTCLEKCELCVVLVVGLVGACQIIINLASKTQSQRGEDIKTGQDQAIEHALQFKDSTDVTSGECEPLFAEIRILGRSKNKVAREILEAFFIKRLAKIV